VQKHNTLNLDRITNNQEVNNYECSDDPNVGRKHKLQPCACFLITMDSIHQWSKSWFLDPCRFSQAMKTDDIGHDIVYIVEIILVSSNHIDIKDNPIQSSCSMCSILLELHKYELLLLPRNICDTYCWLWKYVHVIVLCQP